jgi:hypothetical protein
MWSRTFLIKYVFKKLHAVKKSIIVCCCWQQHGAVKSNQPSSRRYPTSGAWLYWRCGFPGAVQCALYTSNASCRHAWPYESRRRCIYHPLIDVITLLSLSRMDGQLWTWSRGRQETGSRQRRMGASDPRARASKRRLAARSARAEQLNSSNGRQRRLQFSHRPTTL